MSQIGPAQMQDFLLQPSDQDWSRLLAPFSPPVPEQFDLVLATRFLDFFFVAPEGSVHWLDTHAGGVTQVAPSLAAFESAFETEYPNWLMVDFVRAAVERGQVLQPGECYTFRELPALSGAYEMGNVDVADTAHTLDFLGKVFRQLQDIPDGARVQVKVL